MSRVAAALIAFAVAVSPLAAQPSPWNAVAQALAKSTVFVQLGEGSCTGFVINSNAKDDKQDVDYVLTAAHCYAKDLYVAGQPASVKSRDEKKDLLVLQVEDLDKPAIKLAKANPKVGDEVASFGYGYGLERPMLRVTHISDDQIYIPYQGIGGPLVAVDITFIPGMSGGPVVNEAGELVQIVQMSTEIVGFGVGAEVIREKVGKFFEAK